MRTDPALAFVFPGQGSQSVGMLSALAAEFPVVQRTLEEASEHAGRDLWTLVRDGPEETLNLTEHTQPALLAAGVAVWRVCRELDAPLPAMVAGHSLGEYSALVCAGVLEFTAGVGLVTERGRCMQGAVAPGAGAMAAILGLDDAAVEECCRRAADAETVSVANYNSPGQTVIAGHRDAVARAIEYAKEMGARRAVLLPVSVPSHCDLMREAAADFAAELSTVSMNDAAIPVVQNVDATARTDAAGIRNALLEQMYSPVRWVDSIAAMHGAGIRRMVECGPGKVLAGLIRRIERGLEVHPAEHAVLASL